MVVPRGLSMPSDARSQAFSCRRRASWFCVFSISVSRSRMDRSRYAVESPLSRKPEDGICGFMNPGDPPLAVCEPDRPVRPKLDPPLEDCSKGLHRVGGFETLPPTITRPPMVASCQPANCTHLKTGSNGYDSKRRACKDPARGPVNPVDRSRVEAAGRRTCLTPARKAELVSLIMERARGDALP